MMNNIQWDGLLLKQLIHAGTDWVGEHVSQLNAIDVYPKPWSAAGTDIYLTLQAACGELNSCSSDSASDMAEAAARGAVMGARGHQGVLFGFWLRGLAKSLENKRRISARDFAQAMTEAADHMYRGELKPVEGTTVTVAREAAGAAISAATTSVDLRYILQETVATAKAVVDCTPDLLPALKEAGVVHSGGLALAIFLEGMERHLARLPTGTHSEAETQAGAGQGESAGWSTVKETDPQMWIYEAAARLEWLLDEESQDTETRSIAANVRRHIHSSIHAERDYEYLLNRIEELINRLRDAETSKSLSLVEELLEALRAQASVEARGSEQKDITSSRTL